jgi:hypothetical protein
MVISLTGGMAALSGHCWHVNREVFVRYWKFWHIRSMPDDTFLVFVL